MAVATGEGPADADFPAQRGRLVSSHKPIDNRTHRTTRSGRPTGATASHQPERTADGVARLANRRVDPPIGRTCFAIDAKLSSDAGEHCRFPRKQHCGQREPSAAFPHHPAEHRRVDQRCFDMYGQLLARISGASDDAGSCEAHDYSCLIFGRRNVSEERVVAKSRSATFGPTSRSLNPAIVRS